MPPILSTVAGLRPLDRAASRAASPAALEAALLAVFAACLTWSAWQLHPAWDDGWLWLQRLEGDASLRGSMADRPLLGWIWAALAEAGALLPVSGVVHWIGWFGLGWVTRGLWRRAFPSRRQYGVVAAVLVVGTVLLELQHVLINPVWGGLLGVVLVYAALLAIDSRGPHRSRAARWARRALAAVAVGFACLLSEYGLLAVLALVVFVLVRGGEGTSGGRWAAPWRDVLVLLVPAVAGYALFVLLSDAGVRPDTRPGSLLEMTPGRLLAMPFVVLTELWQGGAGNLLVRTGRLEVASAESLATALAAALGAAMVYGLVRRGEAGVGDDRGGGEQGDDDGGPAARRAAWALLAAAAAGLLAMVVAGRIPRSGVNSRLFLPAAPPIACLSLWLVLRVTRPALKNAAVVAMTLVVVFGSVGDTVAHLADRRGVGRLAATVEPHLDPRGFTLVVLLQPRAEPHQRRASGHELTARVAEGLRPSLRKRLWVLRFEALDGEGVEGVGGLGEVDPHPVLERRLRGLAGRVEVTRVLWLELDRQLRPLQVRVVTASPGRGTAPVLPYLPPAPAPAPASVPM